jgi:hypothetical protein
MKNNSITSYLYNNHLTDESVALYADAIILDKVEILPEEILDHTENCSFCKKVVFSVYEINKTKNKEYENNHPFFNQASANKFHPFSNKFHLFKLAASILILISIIGLITVLTKNNKNILVNNLNKEKKVINIPNDSIINNQGKAVGKPIVNEKKEKVKPTLADNLREYPLYENLIAETYRINDIEVTLPGLNQTIKSGAPITFKLNSNPLTAVTLNIYNNKGVKVYEKKDILTSDFSLSFKLSTGLYYWKIIMDDNLLQVGKFIIK